MSLVAVGKLVNVRENEYQTARGPQCDLLADLESPHQGTHPGRVTISYKLWDKARELEGQAVAAVLYVSARTGKKGPFSEVVVMDLVPIKA